MSSIESSQGHWPIMGSLPHQVGQERTDMCDNGTFLRRSLRLNAAELASLVESVLPVATKLAQIVATSEFVEWDREDLSSLRDWVDHAYVSLVSLCEGAANRVDFELSELEESPPVPSHPQS